MPAAPPNTMRFLRLLERLGYENATVYGVVHGRRLQLAYKEGNRMVWYKGSVSVVCSSGHVDIFMDDGDYEQYSIDELESMYEKGELRRPR